MCETGINWAVFGIVSVSLLFLGTLFAGLVWKLGRMKEGYTSLLVVAGVLITLGGVAIICWQAALLCLACFTASGLPMIIGDIAKYVTMREHDKRSMDDN